jgi:N-acylglucosamine 2-epimerase
MNQTCFTQLPVSLTSPQNAHQLYRSTLLDEVIPFWEKFGKDTQFGGLGNVLDDEGNTLGHDKFIWSQGRALWLFSALYNRIEARPEWLEFARHIYDYLSQNGRDERGRWMYRLDKNGTILERDTSIYADAFAMYGLGEYFAASGDKGALQMALETAQNTQQRLAQPDSYGIAPYEIPDGLKTQGIAMIFSFFFYSLGEIAGRPELCREGLRYADEILCDFYRPEFDAVLEFVSLDGEFSNTPPGRACVPGHVIEALWFLITIFERTGDTERIAKCCRLIRRHLELAWDNKNGGLMLALDIAGQKPIYWQQHDCKALWVHAEALVATAYAYRHTRADWCLEWHERIQKFTFENYAVPSGGWPNWLDRDNRIMPSPALPVKDPLHLPRALLYLTQLTADELRSEAGSTPGSAARVAL